MVSTARKAALAALMSLSVLLATCDAQLQFRDSKPKRGIASLGYGLPGVAVPAAGSLVAPYNYFFRSQPAHYAAAAPLSLAGHYAAAPAAPAYAAPAPAYAAPAAAYAAPAHAYAAPHAAYAAAPAAYSAAPAAYAASPVGPYAAAPAAFASPAAAAYAKPAAAGYGYLG
ncbi:cuticle protein 16.5-like [Schistocerca serialis cubense]|uniref:cuticle protein 16.5-like n=1 Tax=Schistocerca serialis cubense TaxID=2023355 RepID=UPI00214E5468|nr:cuticle protein 16.5-like [Schistocerca serialis cubense]